MTVKGISNSNFSRRQFVGQLAAAGIVTTMVPMSRLARADAGQAISFTWAGYDIPQFYGAYKDKHGSSPEYVIFADEYEAFNKVKLGFAPDIVQPCAALVPQWRDAALIQPIDTSRLSHWGDVFPILKDLPGVQSNGEQWFIPWNWGRTSITYRTDLVDWKGEDSYGLLWDERFKGKLAVFDSADETVFTAAIFAGVDPCNMSVADRAKVMSLLKQQKSLLRFYATTETDSTQALASGEVVAALTWDTGAAQLRSQNVPVRFMIPKEGVETWVCGMVLTKNAPHLEKAYDLINAMLSPEAGSYCISDYGMGHSNKLSFDRVSDQKLADLQLPRDPTELLKSGVMYCKMKDKEDIITEFEALKAGQ